MTAATSASSSPADAAARPTISASLVVHNEEAHIREALESIHGAVDQIVILHDGPCGDRTLEIAAEYTNEISCTEDNAGSAELLRPRAIEACRGDWVLVLDADERVTPELRRALPELVADETADAYGFAWPYVTADGKPVSNCSTSGKRFLFRRSRMYTIGLPHMTPESYGRSVGRGDLAVEHVLKFASAGRQLRRMHYVNRSRARKAAAILAGGLEAVPTWNVDLGERRAKNVRKVDWFIRRPLAGLLLIPAWGFFHRFVLRGYFRSGLWGLHDSLDIPVFQAWTCLYRIRDRFRGAAPP